MPGRGVYRSQKLGLESPANLFNTGVILSEALFFLEQDQLNLTLTTTLTLNMHRAGKESSRFQLRQAKHNKGL